MWTAGWICLALAAFFLFLALRGIRRRRKWKGAVRLPAQAVEVETRKTWSDSTTIDDDRSSTCVTWEAPWKGRTLSFRKEYPGIVENPAKGDRISLLYDPVGSRWALWKEVRSLWTMWGWFALLCGIAAFSFFLHGQEILTALSDYTVEVPNLPGALFCGLLGAGCAMGAFAFVQVFLRREIHSFGAPLLWGIKRLLGHLEEVEAVCEGWIEKGDGEGGVSSYPLFSFLESGKKVEWFSPCTSARKAYVPGSRYVLYRDRKGRLGPGPRFADWLRLPFSWIPLAFFLFFALSLALAAVWMLWLAGSGVAYCWSHL